LSDAQAIAAVHVSVSRKTYDNLFSADTVNQFPVEFRARQWHQTIEMSDSADTAVFVGEDADNTIVGFGCCSRQRSEELVAKGFAGEFQSIYVLPSAQGRGVGRTLVAEMARYLSSPRLGHFYLWSRGVPQMMPARHEFGGRQIGVLYVEKHDHAPVVAIKNVGQDVKEGGIYYRYVGETRLIKPGELRQIIAAREQRAIAEFSSRMTRVATGKEATIDLDSGEVAGTSGKFVIDKSLLSSIQFVREGEFNEAKGAPALRLIGDVEPVSEAERERTRIIRENVTPDAVIRDFLRNEKVAEPMQYIHFQAHAQRKWFPVWFYVDQTKATATEVADDLRSQVATYPSSRDALVDRLVRKESAFRQSTGKAEELRTKLVRG